MYGALGPEGVPLQLGTQLAAAEHRPDRGADRRACSATRPSSSPTTITPTWPFSSTASSARFRSAWAWFPPPWSSRALSGDFATGSQTCLYWLHVHAQDGIVHIESPTPKVYELAQFFAIWHVPLSANQIGAYKGTVTATVDGKPWTGNPGADPAQGAHPDRAQSRWADRDPAADQLERHRPLSASHAEPRPGGSAGAAALTTGGAGARSKLPGDARHGPRQHAAHPDRPAHPGPVLADQPIYLRGPGRLGPGRLLVLPGCG